MPIFEYKCSNCENKIEIYVANESELPKCPKCGELMVKQISVPSRPVIN